MQQILREIDAAIRCSNKNGSAWMTNCAACGCKLCLLRAESGSHVALFHTYLHGAWDTGPWICHIATAPGRCAEVYYVYYSSAEAIPSRARGPAAACRLAPANQ